MEKDDELLTQQLKALRAAALRNGGRNLKKAIEIANDHLSAEHELKRGTVDGWFTGTVPPDFTPLWGLLKVLLLWRDGTEPRDPGARVPASAPPAAGLAQDRRWAEWNRYWREADAARRTGGGRRPTGARSPRPSRAKPELPAAPGVPVADADPVRDLAVHQAIDARRGHGTAQSGASLPAYVERAHDQWLRERVSQVQERSALAVLVGDSSTGKTRALWEAIRDLPKGWRVWAPAGRVALLTDLSELRSLDRTVVWLNEMQRYLLPFGQPDPDGQAAACLTALLADATRGPVLVVGTLWHQHHRELIRVPDRSGADPHQYARALLKGAVNVVPETFTDADRAELRRGPSGDTRLAEALERGGVRITQYLAGGYALLERDAKAPPEARALLDAAADARRLGHGEELGEDFLRAAAAAYLDPGHWAVQTKDWRTSWFEDALEYTGEPCRGVPGLLTQSVAPPGRPAQTGPGVYVLSDYVHNHLARARRYTRPPAALWAAAREHVTSPDDLHALASAARDRSRYRIAEHLYQREAERVAEAGSPDGMARAAARSSVAGRFKQAVRFAEQAAEAGWPEDLFAAEKAIIHEWEQARQRAKRAPETDTPHGMARWADEVARDGGWDEAVRLADRAARAGCTDGLAWVALRSAEAGRWEDAVRLAERAAKAGRVDGLDWVAAESGRAGRWDEAVWLAEQAAYAGCPASLARVASQLSGAWRWQQAVELAERAADAGRPEGLGWVAQRLAESGRWEDAVRLAEQALDVGHTDGLEVVAERLAGSGQWDEAKRLAGRGAAVGFPGGLTRLARRLARAGESQEAVRLAEEAADAGDLMSLCEVAETQACAGRWESAEYLTRRAADAGQYVGRFVQLYGWWQDGRRVADNETFSRRGLAADGKLEADWR